MELLDKFIQNWQCKSFAPADKIVLLAVSGGIDSMVLAHLFLAAKIPFAIAHCNYKLRDEDSDKDEQLVTNWALAHSIPFHNISFNTKQKAEEWKKGTQETARILRYEWFDLLCRENKYYKIATAHHANDNAETLLMNLFKGTGIAGLHGIPEQTDRVVRPLLFAERDDVIAYQQAHNVPYRDDSSNASDDYLRNSVRHNLIPVAQQLFPNAVQQLNSSIRRFAEAEELYHKAINKERKELLEQRGNDWYIPVLKLNRRKPLNTICYELFTPFGFSSLQVPQLISLLSSASGHFIESETHRVIRNRDFLIITTKKAAGADMLQIEGVPCNIIAGHNHIHFSIEKKPSKIPAQPNIACIDLKNIVFPIILRKWRTGDYFYPLGMGMKKKKLSRYFIDQKLPLHKKEDVWVLESQKKIAWVAGMRLDERFKIRDTTEQVLFIEIKPA